MDKITDLIIAFMNSKYYIPVSIAIIIITIVALILAFYRVVKVMFERFYNKKEYSIIDETKSRGSYFPAIFQAEFGEIHMLVLHEDKDAFIELSRRLGIEPDIIKKEDKK